MKKLLIFCLLLFGVQCIAQNYCVITLKNGKKYITDTEKLDSIGFSEIIDVDSAQTIEYSNSRLESLGNEVRSHCDSILELYTKMDSLSNNVLDIVASNSNLNRELNGPSFYQPTDIKSGSLTSTGTYTENTDTHFVIADVRNFVGGKVTITGSYIQWGFLSDFNVPNKSTWVGSRMTASSDPCTDIEIPSGAIYLYVYLYKSTTIPTISVDGQTKGLKQDVETLQGTIENADLRTNFVQYSATNEKLNIYIPTKVGFVKYVFIHSTDSTKNCDIWRMDKAFACDGSKTERYNITTDGEWECAVHLEGRSDFSGGTLHGDEVLSNITFILDGKTVSTTDLSGGVDFEELSIMQSSSLYDPADSTTIFAEHTSQHIFNASGLVIKQTIKWLITESVTNSYLAMFPASKSIFEKFNSDIDYTPANTAASTTLEKVRCVNIWSETYGVFAKFATPIFDTSHDAFLMHDNGTSNYWKCYYFNHASSASKVEAGSVWKTNTEYKIEIGK